MSRAHALLLAALLVRLAALMAFPPAAILRGMAAGFRLSQVRRRLGREVLLCKLCSSSSPGPLLAPRLIEHVRSEIAQSVESALEHSEFRSNAPVVAERVCSLLLNDPVFAASNAALDAHRKLLISALKQLSPDDCSQLATEACDLHTLLDKIANQRKQGEEIFENIITHHRNLTRVHWDQAVADKTALRHYSASATAMGKKPWVRFANNWMARVMVHFFQRGGAARHHTRATREANRSNAVLGDYVKDLIAARSDTDHRIQVLDVGSCYNPLRSGELAERLDVTALDLFPGDESVLQCDFLQLEVGPAGSEPQFFDPDPDFPAVRRLKRLPAHSFDALTMSLVLSYLPTSDQREAMVRKARDLLRGPTAEHPHNRGLLLIVEKESVFQTPDGQYEGLFSRANLLHAWKQTFHSTGWELVTYQHLSVPDSDRRCHGFVLATGSAAPAPAAVDAVADKSPQMGLWIKQDFSLNPPTRPRTRPGPVAGDGATFPLHPPSRALPVGIVGGGIAGAALALALQQNGIPFHLFERDAQLSQRRQGYALTIQQASMTLNDLRLSAQVFARGATSLGHYSFDHAGRSLGAYGRSLGSSGGAERAAAGDEDERDPRRALSRHNVHIPRQALREILLEGLDPDAVLWDKKFADLREDGDSVHAHFSDGSEYALGALVGADGVFSAVRRRLTQLRLPSVVTAPSPVCNPFDLAYLGLMVVLGIAPVRSSHDGTVLCQRQWLDGCTRVFTMPFDKDWSMWQMSFPLSEAEALGLAQAGRVGERSADAAAANLKAAALQRCAGWDPVLVQLLESTDERLVSGHPVYDRVLDRDSVPFLSAESRVTLIGDAAHPMSPFKGQGANQALLDALHLSKSVLSSDLAVPGRRALGYALRCFEQAMLQRVQPKVEQSHQAAIYLHSPAALVVANVTRASAAKEALTASP